MSIENTIAGFHHDKISAYDSKYRNLISIFDDIAFENYDYDIIPGPERKSIRNHLLKNGWTEQGSRKFAHSSGKELLLTKPTAALGGNPADRLSETIAETTSSQYILTTPTQIILVMLMNNEWDQETVERLVSFHPANIEKIKQWMNNDSIKSPGKEAWAKVKAKQEECIQKRKSRELIRYPLKKHYKKEAQ